MTGERIREEFEQWCLPDAPSEYEPGYWRCWQAAWARGAEAEREACAKIAGSWGTDEVRREQLAHAIRARARED